ncbi:MAG: dephospho-CoA kinase [Mariprofundus sp.]|nr:dephospho-CoA kinase [Mariprofundus sp.]
MKQSRCIGLTGGIGSGKSTVAKLFCALGVPVLDLDQLGHWLTEPGGEGLDALKTAFGEHICHADGSLDRKGLADYCFADPERTKQLNAVMHPLIWQQEVCWLAAQQADYVMIEASVLLESGGASRMDKLMVVLADQEVRLQRVLKRGKQGALAFQAIVSRQCDDQLRRAKADYIIDNNGEITTLHKQVRDLHGQLSS